MLAMGVGCSIYEQQPDSSPVPEPVPEAYTHYLLPDTVPYHPDNPYTEEKRLAGEKIFFMKINGKACADCHEPRFGFTAGMAQSETGTDRPPIKSPSSIGIAGSEMLLWNGAASSLPENLAFTPSHDDSLQASANWYGTSSGIIQAMFALHGSAHDMAIIADSIEVHAPEAVGLLAAAYPTIRRDLLCDDITVACVLDIFQRSLIPRSPVQKWLRGEGGIDAAALRGLVLFDRSCESCHQAPWLGADRFARLGLGPLVNEFHDGTHKANQGRASFTGIEADKYRFRIPRLNTNIAQHGSYGHGGSFLHLRNMVEYHNLGIAEVDSIGTELAPMGLSSGEVDDIVAFLNLCTDSELARLDD